MITNFPEIPADVLLLNLKPKNLTSKELEPIIYSEHLYLGYDARLGVFILISAADIGNLADTLPTLEELGYKNIKNIKQISQADLKWNDDKFYV